MRAWRPYQTPERMTKAKKCEIKEHKLKNESRKKEQKYSDLVRARTSIEWGARQFARELVGIAILIQIKQQTDGQDRLCS